MSVWLLLIALCFQPASDDPKPYPLKPGEFPPVGSERVVDGVLLEADFIHRTGQFARVDNGELVNFTLLPYATLFHLNAEADLRDIPLGTLLHFSAYADERGDFTKIAAIRDDFTNLARDGLAYRLDEVKKGENKLIVSVKDAPRREFQVDSSTRYWKDDKRARIEDLTVVDPLLLNRSGKDRVAEVWSGDQAQKFATEAQRTRHKTFIRQRGLACWIDKVEDKKLTVTLFGDPAGLRALMKDEGIDPAQWAKERRGVYAAVANEELRTYNPPVDQRRATVLQSDEIQDGGIGCGGIRWVIEPDILLEGFRKGRVIRLFAHHSWPSLDMPFGETLYSEVPDFQPDTIDPNLYPYRVDNGNTHLPWYRPKPGEFPPFHSHHLVQGELLKVDERGRSGQFRADRTGDVVNFTLPPYGSVLSHNAEAELQDIPLATRCRFLLHQDDRSKFTKAAVISDEFTHDAADDFTFRLDTIKLDQNKIVVAKQHGLVKNEKEEMVRPPDYGRAEFAVNDRTRVWKGDKPITLNDLAVGDELRFNTSGRSATSRGVCTEIWVGVETHKLATDRQRTNHHNLLKKRGIPAWIDQVEGKKFTISLFSGKRKEFPAFLNGDPNGESVYVQLADDELHPIGAKAVKMTYQGHPPEESTAGTYGSSGVRWQMEPAEPIEGLTPGRVVRVFREGWLRP